MTRAQKTFQVNDRESQRDALEKWKSWTMKSD